jgi:hypothetical protein
MRSSSFAGYTIVETMIFLAISVAFFGSVVSTMSRQTTRTRFTESVETFEARLQDVLNDVSTGFYPSNSDFRCIASINGPTFSNGANQQGTNTGCVFVGKAIQFAPNTGAGNYNIFTMVGNRLGTDASNTNEEVTSIAETKPRLLGVRAQTGRGVVDGGAFSSGVVVSKVVSLGDGLPISGLAIVSDFTKKVPINNSITGNSSRVQLAAVKNTNLGMTADGFASRVEHPSTVNLDFASAQAGILICLREGSNGRKASITIGKNNQQLSLERTIDSWEEAQCN